MHTKRSSSSVLVITNWRDLAHPDAGGAELLCDELARGFGRNGWDVVFLTAAVEGAPTTEGRDGYTIIRRGGRYTVYPWALAWILVHRRAVRAAVDSENGIPFFSPLVLPRRTPVLLLLHHVHQDQFAQYFSPLAAAVGRVLERTGSRLVYRHRTVVAISPSTRSGARRRLGLRGDIVVVPPGCNAVVNPPAGPRPRSVKPRLVCVGRLVPHKRTGLVIGAMARLAERIPDLELHLVGDGPERVLLHQQVRQLQLEDRVVLHGALDDADRDALMATAWMTVNASEREGWGLSVVEANALGVPVLAYRRPGLRDSIRHGATGWLIDDDADLADEIARALGQLADPEFAEMVGERARQWVSRFTWEAMTDGMLDVLLAEEGRLAHLPGERRIPTDLATVVTVPKELLGADTQPVFRGTDRVRMEDGGLVVLLRGADTQTARLALRRAGFTPAVIDHPSVRVSVARPADHVSPEGVEGWSLGNDHWREDTLAG